MSRRHPGRHQPHRARPALPHKRHDDATGWGTSPRHPPGVARHRLRL